MLDRVSKTISRYNMLPHGSRAIAAVSGGPDSVCLVHVLAELAPRLGISLEAAHLNHQLRGAESDADQQFVQELAAKLKLPLHLARTDVASAVQKNGGNLEQAARRARLEFFRGLNRAGASGMVATGHTRDDQAETVLLRILRGAGPPGLAGIHPVAAWGIVRPLLDVTRAEILEFLRARGIAWREDSSNRDPRYARNRLRRELMPRLIHDWNPRLTDALAHLADVSWEEERWWTSGDSPLRAIPQECVAGGVEIDVRALGPLPRAVARRVIRRAIASAKGDLRGIEFEHIERVLELASKDAGSGSVDLPGLEVQRSFDWIRLAAPGVPAAIEPVTVEIPGAYPWAPGKCLIRLDVIESGRGLDGGREPGRGAGQACANLKSEVLSLSRISGTVQLRGWKPGDRYCPRGQTRVRKLKDLFSAARVPSWQRRSWPMLMNGDKILWSREFGVAADDAAEGESGPVLRISEVKAHVNESFATDISS